ncbi:MAG: magnesium transporter CorA family protein [Parcubacteria group bacterium]|nr:magnesium transporter CorA family protein [Parcubacteria group bacterium]
MSHKEISIDTFRWAHFTKPNLDDIALINTFFNFDPRIIEYIKEPTRHPLIEEYEDHFFFIVHFPIIYPTWDPNDIVEVDFLVTKDTLITVSYREFDELDKIIETCEKDSVLRTTLSRYQTASMIYFIIDRLFQKLLKDIDYLEEQIISLEEKIFEKQNRELVLEISNTRRDILDFRRTFFPQEIVFRLLPEKIEELYGKDAMQYFSRIVPVYDKIKNFLENKYEAILVLYQTNESLAAHRLNNIITVLTVASAILMPLNFIASVWGMNYAKMPLVEQPFGFWIIIGSMGVVATILLLIFKKKNWL